MADNLTTWNPFAALPNPDTFGRAIRFRGLARWAYGGPAGFASRIVYHKCAIPFWVYIETFIPAFLELALIAAVPLLDDLIIDEARVLAGARPGKGFRMVGHTTRFRQEFKQTTSRRWSQNALKTMLVIDTPLEQIGYTILLIAAGAQFFYRWTSMIEAFQFCSENANNYLVSRSRGPGQTGVLPGGASINMSTLEQEFGPVSSSASGADGPGGSLSATLSINVVGPVGGITGVKARLRWFGLLGERIFDGGEVNLQEGEPADLMVNASWFEPRPSGGTLVWEVVGPAVPIGLETSGAFVVFHRVQP